MQQARVCHASASWGVEVPVRGSQGPAVSSPASQGRELSSIFVNNQIILVFIYYGEFLSFFIIKLSNHV